MVYRAWFEVILFNVGIRSGKVQSSSSQDRQTLRSLQAVHAKKNGVSHECRRKWRVECIMPGIILTAMYSEEGVIAGFSLHGLRLALGTKTCPHRPQAFKTVNNGQAFP